MKKIASLLLTVVMLAAMLTVFAVPAFAEGEPIECDTTKPNIEITTAEDYIIKQDCTLKRLNVSNKDSTLTIPEGVTVTVTSKALISGTVELNGTLDVSECPDMGFSGEKNINIGKTGTLVKKGADNVPYTPSNPSIPSIPTYMTTLSEGNIWIIAIIAVVVIAGVVTLVIVKKKKKKLAPAGGGESKDGE